MRTNDLFPLEVTDVITCVQCDKIQIISKAKYKYGLDFCCESCIKKYETTGVDLK